MRVSLQVKTGPLSGRRIDIRDGQIARFGATEWADYSFPNDPEIRDIHFSLQCGHQRCLLRAASPDAIVLVNAEPVQEVTLHTGDEIRAGQTKLAVFVDGEEPRGRDADSDGQRPTAEDAAPPAGRSLVETCEYLELPEDVKPLAIGSPAAAAFLQALVAAEQFPPAIRWQAHALPKDESVRWACDCVDEVVQKPLPAKQRAAIDAARTWCDDPSEEHRRAAEAAAEQAEYEGVGGMLAAAAFWSGGSLGPADQAEVPPDDRLTGQAVTAALLMAAVEDDPAAAPAAFRRFLNKSQVGSSA